MEKQFLLIFTFICLSLFCCQNGKEKKVKLESYESYNINDFTLVQNYSVDEDTKNKLSDYIYDGHQPWRCDLRETALVYLTINTNYKDIFVLYGTNIFDKNKLLIVSSNTTEAIARFVDNKNDFIMKLITVNVSHNLCFWIPEKLYKKK